MTLSTYHDDPSSLPSNDGDGAPPPVSTSGGRVEDSAAATASFPWDVSAATPGAGRDAGRDDEVRRPASASAADVSPRPRGYTSERRRRKVLLAACVLLALVVVGWIYGTRDKSRASSGLRGGILGRGGGGACEDDPTFVIDDAKHHTCFTFVEHVGRPALHESRCNKPVGRYDKRGAELLLKDVCRASCGMCVKESGPAVAESKPPSEQANEGGKDQVDSSGGAETSATTQAETAAAIDNQPPISQPVDGGQPETAKGAAAGVGTQDSATQGIAGGEVKDSAGGQSGGEKAGAEANNVADGPSKEVGEGSATTQNETVATAENQPPISQLVVEGQAEAAEGATAGAGAHVSVTTGIAGGEAKDSVDGHSGGENAGAGASNVADGPNTGVGKVPANTATQGNDASDEGTDTASEAQQVVATSSSTAGSEGSNAAESAVEPVVEGIGEGAALSASEEPLPAPSATSEDGCDDDPLFHLSSNGKGCEGIVASVGQAALLETQCDAATVIVGSSELWLVKYHCRWSCGMCEGGS